MGGNGGSLSEEDMFKISQAALNALRAEPQIMSIIDEHNRRKKSSHEGGGSDKYSRKSLMNSSGRKINTDELVDKSTHKSKNDPVQIMLPRRESTKDLHSKTPPRSDASRRVESARRDNHDTQGTDRKHKRAPSESSKKSMTSPRAEPKDKKHKKDKEKEKKVKKDKKDKKEKDKDKDKKKRTSRVEGSKSKEVAEQDPDKTIEMTPH